MRRNRKIMKTVQKKSRWRTSSIGLSSLIVSSVIMMLLVFWANTQNNEILKAIGDQEKTIRSLNDELTRENAKWDELKVPDRLKTALTRFGLEMDYPRPDQIVDMGRNGKPVPGQLSLARNAGRGASAPIVKVTPKNRKNGRKK